MAFKPAPELESLSEKARKSGLSVEPRGAARHLADIVVTEHGVADLRGASLAERAKRLIAIAAPDHRESLQVAWDRGRSLL